jgi:hypothetical protein
MCIAPPPRRPDPTNPSDSSWNVEQPVHRRYPLRLHLVPKLLEARRVGRMHDPWARLRGFQFPLTGGGTNALISWWPNPTTLSRVR